MFEIAEIFVHRDERLVISLPVLRDGRVIGLVYRQDVLDAIIDLVAKFPRPEAAVLYLSSLKDRDEILRGVCKKMVDFPALRVPLEIDVNVSTTSWEKLKRVEL